MTYIQANVGPRAFFSNPSERKRHFHFYARDRVRALIKGRRSCRRSLVNDSMIKLSFVATVFMRPVPLRPSIILGTVKVGESALILLRLNILDK